VILKIPKYIYVTEKFNLEELQMIKNNRPMAINISYKGRQIGFSAGECKKLAHFFTPMEEYILAKRFGLEYIAEKEVQEKLTTETPKTKVQSENRENELKAISDEMNSGKDVEQEMLLKQVQNLKIEALKAMEAVEQKRIRTEVAVDFEQKQFQEDDIISMKDKLKQKTSIVEGPVENLISESNEEVLLEKPTKKTPAKKTAKKTPAKKTAKK